MSRKLQRWQVVVGVILLLLLCLAGGAWLWWCHERDTWTDEAPRTMPVVELTQPERRRLAPRYKRLHDALRQGRAVEVRFEANELNGLVSLADELSGLRGKVALTVEGEELVAQVSVPIGAEVPLVAGRYVNGDFRLKCELAGEQMRLEVISGKTAQGQAYPPWMLQRLNEMLRQPEMQRQVARQFNKHVSELRVEKDGVVVKTKAR